MFLELMGGIVCAAGMAAYGVRGRSSRCFGSSVWRGTRTRPAIALTFDDGPGEATAELLGILERHRVRATFFQCGVNAERMPETARMVSAAGHEIGNHAYSHTPLWLRRPSFVAREVERAQQVLERIHGRAPRLFRAPFGVRWFGLRGVQKRLGLTGVMWTASGLDWKLPSQRIVHRLLDATSNGAIFCLHEGRGSQAHAHVRPALEAVSQLIPLLLERGFHFETVSEILCPTISNNA